VERDVSVEIDVVVWPAIVTVVVLVDVEGRTRKRLTAIRRPAIRMLAGMR
jgi:hypothetical protein